MAHQVILPKLTYEMQEGRILEWLCEPGDSVAVGQPLFVAETDKAAVEVPAEEAGTLLSILVEAGDTTGVGLPVAWIGAPGEAPGAAIATAATLPDGAAAVPEPAPAGEAVRVVASPMAKRLARELGVDLADVQAYCGDKRIRESDIRAFAELKAAPAGPAAPLAPIATSEPGFELVTPSPLQRAMAQHLSQAAAIPQAAAAREVDLSNLKQLRAELLEDWQAAHGQRLTLTHMLAALVARALESCPALNASWTEEGVRVYRQVNLGVAMATERGLVVPVVRDAGQRSLAELAAEIVRLQQAAERNRLSPQDLEGGTFTLTNVGTLGIELSIPVLNPPQSAILGIGAERSQVRLEENKLWAAPVCWITTVTDHRVVDGAAMGAFLQEIKRLVEDPRPVLVP